MFDDTRLALLADLVDYETWEIEYSHPPVLHRVFNLEDAHRLEGEDAVIGLDPSQRLG